MLHKLLDRILTRDTSSPFKAYFRAVLEQSGGAAPTMDEANRDFHQLMHSQTLFTSV